MSSPLDQTKTVGKIAAFVGRDGMSEERGLVEYLNECLSSGKVQLPVSNMTGLRLQQEISKEGANPKVLEKLIATDQALTAQVLKIANSAFYRGLHKASSVREAILRLGMIEVSNIITLVTQKQTFQSKDPFIGELLEKLWQHAVACAVGAQWLARSCNYPNILNEAFLAGLLHDIGKLFLLTVIEANKLSEKFNLRLNREMIYHALADLHTEYVYSLLKQWNFPEGYYQVAKEYHQDNYDPKNDLLVILRMANQTCRRMGIGLAADSDILLSATPEATLLGLSEIAVAELQIKIEDSLLLAHVE
jgi:HD-like signal output (HDOD) protein